MEPPPARGAGRAAIPGGTGGQGRILLAAACCLSACCCPADSAKLGVDLQFVPPCCSWNSSAAAALAAAAAPAAPQQARPRGMGMGSASCTALQTCSRPSESRTSQATSQRWVTGFVRLGNRVVWAKEHSRHRMRVGLWRFSRHVTGNGPAVLKSHHCSRPCCSCLRRGS